RTFEGRAAAVIVGAASAMNGGSFVEPRKVRKRAWKLGEVMKLRNASAAAELICTFGLPANFAALIAYAWNELTRRLFPPVAAAPTRRPAAAVRLAHIAQGQAGSTGIQRPDRVLLHGRSGCAPPRHEIGFSGGAGGRDQRERTGDIMWRVGQDPGRVAGRAEQ